MQFLDIRSSVTIVEFQEGFNHIKGWEEQFLMAMTSVDLKYA